MKLKKIILYDEPAVSEINIPNLTDFLKRTIPAEVIVKDRDREKTINKMKMALNELVVSGIKTNKELHLRILEDNQFQNVNYYIKYLEQELI